MPEAGVEPARPCGQRILNPPRLPVPPLRLLVNFTFFVLIFEGFMRLVVSGGGTGGHFFPALEILRKARDREVETLYVGTERGIEKALEKDIPEKKVFLRTSPVRGVSPLAKIKAFKGILSGVFELLPQMDKDFRTLIMGGYPSVPAGLCTLIKFKKLYIHEQNSVPSATNRSFILFAKRTFITFEYTRKFFKGEFVERVGLPVRSELVKTKITKEGAKEVFGFDPKKPVILFLGGSQGAKFINTLAVDFAKRTGFQVLLLSGKKDYERVVKLAEGLRGFRVFPFRTDMGIVYSCADVAVCRAGASTITELSFFKVPSVFIPYPYAAGDHQFYNAKEIEDLGGAFVIRQEDASPEEVTRLVEKALADRKSMGENIHKFYVPNSADLILDQILQD